MPDQIRSGTGGGHLAKVSGENKLHTYAIVDTTQQHANQDEEQAYNMNTGLITLTDAADTPLMYFKNNETDAFVITGIVVGTAAATVSSGTDVLCQVTFVRNPTTGTIISSTPTDVDINSNRNYGSANTLSNSVAYKGATGDTITNGNDHIYGFQNAGAPRTFYSIVEILPKGTAIGIKVQPPANNTSMRCYVAIIGYLVDSDI